MGSRLSDIFFEDLGKEARTWLGLTPPLVGPDGLWIDPEARIKQKAVQTPIPDPASLRLKAFTHGNVLEIGQMYIAKLENKHRLEMKAALERQAEELEDELRRKYAGDTGSSGVDGMGECKKVVATLMEHFDKCFEDLVETTHKQMRKECQLKVDKERAEIAAYMLTQVQDEVERRDYMLCNDFYDILKNELHILATRYVKQIDEEREISTELLKETIGNYEKMLQDVKMEMEMSAAVDVCRAITQERVDCNDRIRKVQADLRKDQGALVDVIAEMKKKNCALQKMATERLKRLLAWKEKVKVLLQEFQRFINFALKAVPGQSEFLLSFEKLVLKEFPEDSFVLPEDYIHYQECLQDKLRKVDEDPEPSPLLAETSEESLSQVQEEEYGESSSTQYVCCPSHRHSSKECDLNFDYDEFKSMLVKRFSSSIPKPKPKKPKKLVCKMKPRAKPVTIDKTNQWYQTLTLLGEKEKQHEIPTSCFLQKRLAGLLKICNDDPEFAKIMLGCQH